MDRLLTSPFIKLLEIKLRGEGVTQIMKNCIGVMLETKATGRSQVGEGGRIVCQFNLISSLSLIQFQTSLKIN